MAVILEWFEALFGGIHMLIYIILAAIRGALN